MKRIATLAVGLALAGTLSAAPAQAQAVRTFVSPTGVDTASCSLTAPCRTFAAAYAATDAGGEIAVLGTAGYGVLTINKAISIVNGGGFEAAIAVPSGGVGITIGAGTMDAVSLRGLTIDGAGVGKSLTVENCVIRHMTGDGIDFFSTTATSALTVSNSLVADNALSAILLTPTGSVAAVFNHVEVNKNGGVGIWLDGATSAGSDRYPNKPAPSAIPVSCSPLGKTDDGHLVYPMDCPNIPAPVTSPAGVEIVNPDGTVMVISPTRRMQNGSPTGFPSRGPDINNPLPNGYSNVPR